MQGPSCTGLPKTCGPSGNESCCTSLLVPGGAFYRGYDSVAFTDKGYPATVSDFYLDKYEITVGRFRAFVNAGMGTQKKPPAAGAGAHPLIADSGWDSTWNTNLPADTASLRAAMKCDSTFQTWTDTPGGNEDRPQNCMTWFEAAAFCAWDGGRLPTEAEWNYAATGGDEQLEYPWGSSIDPSDASYRVDYTQNCVGDGVPTCTLADLIVVGTKPAGNGRWGHADLAGNVWEWTLDWYGNFPMPCKNCANLVSSPSRVARGGGFENIPYYVLANVRITIPTSDYSDIGSRCAGIGSAEGGGDAGVPDAPGAQPDVFVGGSGGSGGFGGGVVIAGGAGGSMGDASGPADAGATPTRVEDAGRTGDRSDTAAAGCTSDIATPCAALPPFSGAQVLDGNDDDFCNVPSFELNFNNAASGGGRVVVFNSGTSNYPERAIARVAWDSFGIHAFIHVIDPKFVAATNMSYVYNADGVELLFTSTTSGLTGGTAQDAGLAMHVIISPPLAVRAQAIGSNSSQTPLDSSLFWAGTESTGYRVELKLPWPGTPPTAGSQIKFDMELNSADGISTPGDAGPRDAQAILYQGSDPGNSPCGSPLYPYCDDRLWCSTTLQ